MVKRLSKRLLILTAVMIASLLYFFYPASTNHFYPGCALYSFTGFYCPACGSQRAFSELLHGHFLPAARNNALFVAGSVLLIVFLFKNMRIVFSNNQIKLQPVRPYVLWIVLFLILSFWILRNIPCKPFVYLAPA